MTTGCVADFIEALGSLPLLEETRRFELAGDLARRFAQPLDLARELLRRGWLTPYQVNQIFLGRGANLVLGPYVLLERLGEGGMGQVFKARHLRLKRVVALKVIRKERVAHPNAVPRFRREVQAVAQLAHPNIVQAYGAGRVGGTYFFAMEYVEGIDLARLVRDSGPLQVGQACNYVWQAALGLQHAHERRLIHRDIKPANLLVMPAQGGSSTGLPSPSPSPWGQVKILDMGLARLQTSGDKAPPRLTRVGSLIGSPDFVAPEQVRNPLTSDIRADLYSLGCTFYVLLTGQVPFVGGDLSSKLLRHQREAPLPVEQVRRQQLLEGDPEKSNGSGPGADMPAGVAAIVRKLMAKDPGDRYQLPLDLANALATISGHADSSSSVRATRKAIAQAVANAALPQGSGFRPLARRPARNATASAPTPPPDRTTDSRTRPDNRATGKRRLLDVRSRALLVFGGFLLLCLLAHHGGAGSPLAGRASRDSDSATVSKYEAQARRGAAGMLSVSRDEGRPQERLKERGLTP
jgi:serine/threonine protein kinase